MRDETRQSKGERENAISEVGDVEKSKIENEFITTYEKHESYENPMQAAEGGMCANENEANEINFSKSPHNPKKKHKKI